VSRTYLDWLLELPWEAMTDDNLDIDAAQRTLDADHYDLEKVKKRILEYLAVRKLKKDMKGPILCFVGPPGVGKTSLGQSIARTLGRKFIRISLGGVRDEAEIRGHRRTYVGALPGRIIQGLRKAGTHNPVFMLDEVDKVGMDFRGDPSSALLEVLDPEQNHSFSDHYLEVAFDLSRVMFITTANVLDTIPPALRDRMEVMELPGYIEEEKLMIAKGHLIPEQVEAHGLTAEQLRFDDDAVRLIIRSHTREAGVRNLERQIAAVCRGVAKEVAAGRGVPTPTIRAEDIPQYLGPERFMPELAARTWGPGLATGLAWTPTGGDLIFIEAARMPGKGTLTLTGQLGDVMKESANAALSYVRAHAADLGIDGEFFGRTDIHLHVPAGAIPKDGPSAGVAMLVSLASLVIGRQARKEVAMTGEITLRGDVLPVGGIKEKVLAARRAGVKEVILPQTNEKDLVDVPPPVREKLQFHLVRAMPEALELALERQ
jgi:ATP-dependent Lon protease